ncbi:MAG: hypothetical protein J6Y72_05610 [Bacteroidales bacterium]|nr:hypothetical protein [Bacteroidales bacterium]
MQLQSLSERYGVDKRALLEYVGENHIAIVKIVKRRLLVDDAKNFVEIAKKIKSVDPQMKVSLICTDNICSKSVALLEQNGIDVLLQTDEMEE